MMADTWNNRPDRQARKVADPAALLALFLLEHAGSIFAEWSGNLSATKQREMIGQYLGKGRIYIDGSAETIEHWRKVCFGLDAECTARLNWRNL